MDDPELVARVLAGDSTAFDALLRRHAAPLLGTLRSFLGNREDVQEVFQETWLRAHQKLAGLRDPARLRAWLVSIALNLARARLRRPVAEILAHEPEFAAAEEAGAERSDEVARLRQAMAALPRRQREVLDLRVNHALTHAEIAELLGISAESSRANFYQGLRRLKAVLTPRTRMLA